MTLHILDSIQDMQIEAGYGFDEMSVPKLKRIMGGNHSYGVLTTERKDVGRSKNRQHFSKLLRIAQMGGRKAWRVHGIWKEANQKLPALERSIIGINMTFQEAIKIGRQYKQDAIIFKNKADKHPYLYFIDHDSQEVTRYPMKIKVAKGSVKKGWMEERVTDTVQDGEEGGFTAARGASFEGSVDWSKEQVLRVTDKGTLPVERERRGVTRIRKPKKAKKQSTRRAS